MSRMITKKSITKTTPVLLALRAKQKSNLSATSVSQGVNILKTCRLALIAHMIFIVTFTFGAFGMAQLQKAFAANIKSLAVIEENVIRASDLFHGIAPDNDTVIGAAPLPGQDMVLNARTLLRIAMALDVSWRPESGGETIIVRRAATIIDQDMIKATLHQELAQKGIEGRFNLVLSDSMAPLALPQDAAKTVEISAFDYDPVSGQFKAELVAPSLDQPLRRQLASGKVERIIQIPVLRKAVQNGQMITASNIDWIETPAYKVQHDFVLDSDGLIGMTPRRIAMAGEPLRMNEVEQPLMVKRGENVSITYQAGPIQLIAEGKALQNGAQGDLIRVVNFSSNRTIDAFITGARSVEVN